MVEAVPADDVRIDQVMEALPGTTVHGALGLTVVTTLIDAKTAIEAGLHAAKALVAAGVTPQRTYQDLVSRQDIADRLDVSRQAVGNWVRGERHRALPFPAPVTLASGGLWLWSNVVRWISTAGVVELDESALPTLEDHCELDRMIRQGDSHFTAFSLLERQPR